MVFDAYDFMILTSVVVVVSYLYNIISDFTKIPTVILLIGTGLALQHVASYYSLVVPDLQTPLEFAGILGLILIVLEGALDLKISRKKSSLILRSFIAALGVLLITTGCIAWLLNFYAEMDWRRAFVYAIPMGVVSSAIAIPSVSKLSKEKREFIIYESTFSDILGIMVFNYAIADEVLSWLSVRHFFEGLVLILLVSFLSTMILLWLFKYLKGHVKVFLILALLMFIYALVKEIHLPSLLLILIFGLVLNNIGPYLKGKLGKYFHAEKLSEVNNELRIMTNELAFLIRTVFFLLFGFTMDLTLLADVDVLILGSLIILIILFMRFISLKFVASTNVFPEIFIAPRGLITIILFYSIPVGLVTQKFNEGVLTFVIISSSIIMMLGIMFSDKTFDIENELSPVMNGENEVVPEK